MITLRASSSCNNKYFNLFSKLSLPTQTTENKRLDFQLCLCIFSSLGYLAVHQYIFHTNREPVLALWIRSFHSKPETGC